MIAVGLILSIAAAIYVCAYVRLALKDADKRHRESEAEWLRIMAGSGEVDFIQHGSAE